MRRFVLPRSHRPPILAMTLATAFVWTALLALRHIWTTAQYGPICGQSTHCGACYAALGFGVASLVAFSVSIRSSAVLSDQSARA